MTIVQIGSIKSSGLESQWGSGVARRANLMLLNIFTCNWKIEDVFTFVFHYLFFSMCDRCARDQIGIRVHFSGIFDTIFIVFLLFSQVFVLPLCQLLLSRYVCQYWIVSSVLNPLIKVCVTWTSLVLPNHWVFHQSYCPIVHFTPVVIIPKNLLFFVHRNQILGLRVSFGYNFVQFMLPISFWTFGY